MSIFLVNAHLESQYITIVGFLYISVLVISTVFLTYSIWRPWVKHKKYISVLWLCGLLYILGFANTLFLSIGNYSDLLRINFVFNLMLLAILANWQVALATAFISLISSFLFLKNIASMQYLYVASEDIYFKATYSFLLIASGLLVFFKPKQLENTIKDRKAEHMRDRLEFTNEENIKLQDLKNEFLRNVPHEVHTPITGITSLGQMLYKKYDELNDDQLKQYLSIIAQSSIRFESFTKNITDLSKLSSLTVDLHKSAVNISDLVLNRIEVCTELYIEEEADISFNLKIEENIILTIDKYYIQQTIDNLIINAITYTKYTKNALITITLKKLQNKIIFIIQDNGIGIPKEELRLIFGAFITSSKTKSQAEGRGVGLAVCHKVITKHGGEILAQSDGVSGATFKFTLPVKDDVLLRTSKGKTKQHNKDFLLL